MISKVCNFLGDFKIMSASTAIAAVCQAISQSPLAKRVQQVALLTIGAGLLVHIGRKLSPSPHVSTTHSPVSLEAPLPSQDPPLPTEESNPLQAPIAAPSPLSDLAKDVSEQQSPSALTFPRPPQSSYLEILTNRSLRDRYEPEYTRVMAPYYEALAKYDQEHNSHPGLSQKSYKEEISSLTNQLNKFYSIQHRTELSLSEIKRITERIEDKTQLMKASKLIRVSPKDLESPFPKHPIEDGCPADLRIKIKALINMGAAPELHSRGHREIWGLRETLGLSNKLFGH